MNKQPFETMPDVMDAKQIAEALQISKAGAYNLLNNPDFPTLRIGGRKMVMKAELMDWLKGQTNRARKVTEQDKFLDALVKVVQERMTGSLADIPIPAKSDPEAFEKLKLELQSLMLDED